MNRGRPVRRISHAEAEQAVADYIGEPVVVEGLAPLAPLPPLEHVSALLTGRTLSCIDTRTNDYTDVPAAELWRGIAAGERLYNIIDSSLVGTEVERRATLPAFLRNNWLGAGWAGSAEDLRVRKYAFSLVATAAGAFTPLHVNGRCFSGWMHLTAGLKHWWTYPPAARAIALADHERPSDPRTATADTAAPLTTTLRGGELIFVPAGWLHSVETPVLSYGFGGSYVHATTVGAALNSWRADVADGFPPTLDLPAFLRHHGAAA
ncbi:MAG: hypothetical protein EXQ93_05715 [Alphaproteobacteria bacterium]|nr:hypothetical protein [Alphaproteobacteria bacterium]